MDKKPLIVGVDPGTTSAYAVLDIDGNLIGVKSQKGMGLNLIIRETTSLGWIVLIGTDKSKVPNLVKSFSAKTGAKVISPRKDLKISDKNDFIKNFELEAGDEHQKDAVAAAIYAFKKMSPLMNKIDFIVKDNPDLRSAIKNLVIKRDISIYEAIKILRPEEGGQGIIERLIEDREINEQDFNKLYKRLKIYYRENKILEDYNRKLRDNINWLERNQRNLKYRKIVFKVMRPKSYEQILNEKNDSIELLKEEIKKLTIILANKERYYILKKLNTLGSSQFETRKILLSIQKDDILLVDNPNIVSSKTIDELNGVVNIIVHNIPVSRKIQMSLPFVFISSKNLGIQDLGAIAFVEKGKLDEEKKRYNVLSGMIENYKKERIGLI